MRSMIYEGRNRWRCVSARHNYDNAIKSARYTPSKVLEEKTLEDVSGANNREG